MWCVFVRKEILVKWDLEIVLPLIENPFKLDMILPIYGKARVYVNYMLVDTVSGEDNGNPLQYSCVENPMDGGAW